MGNKREKLGEPEEKKDGNPVEEEVKVVVEDQDVKLNEKKKRKKSSAKDSTKTRKTSKDGKQKGKKEKAAVPKVEKKKSYIPVLKDPILANPTSKESNGKGSSIPILQCGECPAELKSRPELLKHMKGHLNMKV